MGGEGGKPVSTKSDECTTSSNQLPQRTDRNQMCVSSEITEEMPRALHKRPQNLFLEIPSRHSDYAPENCVAVNILPVPSPTPKRVNFSPLPSPHNSKICSSPSFSVKEKPSFKSLIPKVSFKFRASSSEIDKAATSLGSSPTRGRPSMLRAFSLNRIFTPRINRTSSFPVTPNLHSNPESMHGDSKKELQLPIHRSRSVPVLNKDGSIKQLDSVGGVFRVIATTPRVKEGQFTASSATATDATAAMVQMKKRIVVVKIFLKKKLCVGYALWSWKKALIHSRWNVAAKAILLWLIKNVLLNGLTLKATRFVMCVNKRSRIYPLHS